MKPLVVLYYHHILPKPGFDVDVELFEWQLGFIRKNFDVVPPEILNDIKKGYKLKKSSILITFDDGFADNYVYAYPILLKYNLNALIFVITSKIEHRKPRLTLIDCWDGRVSYEKLYSPKGEETPFINSLYFKKNLDFLSWEELKIMVKSGTFSVGSHGHEHVKVFYDNKVMGIFNGNNAHWSYGYALGTTPNEGYPIFPMRSSLACRRFVPDLSFLNDPKHEDSIKVKDYTLGVKGVKESEEAYRRRVEDDLKRSRSLIEEELGYFTPYLSWPWGQYSDESMEIAEKVGYEFCFTTEKRAFFGNDFCKIGRIKSVVDRIGFVRKVMTNKFYILAKLYGDLH